jgi:protein-disulfide isomerase
MLIRPIFISKGDLMKVFKQFAKTAIVLSISAVTTLAFAGDKNDLSGFNAAQQTQIKDYVTNAVPQVIMSKPKVVLDAAKKYQQQQQQEQVKTAKKVILAKSNDFLRDPNTPVYNPKGTITLVEFFDYQCSVCHMMYPVINQVAKQFPNLRIVYKDLPIFGPGSVYAAKGSFAAYKQSPQLYLAYHDAMFQSKKMEGQLKEADVDVIAKKVGLDMSKFHKDINSPEISAQLQDNAALAQALKLVGTPAMIIAPSTATSGLSENKLAFIPGGARPAQLTQAVLAVQQASAK